MSYEIELKFRTRDHERVAARLEELGAAKRATVHQEDIYLNHPSRDFAATHEAFRLRKVGDWNALTYKGPKRQGPAKTREEIEIPYESGSEAAESMHRMQGLLGFRTVATIRKSRTAYTLVHDDWPVEVALDEAENLGSFVEIEVIAESENAIAKAQAVVLSLAKELHLDDIESRSYLRMSLELTASEVDD